MVKLVRRRCAIPVAVALCAALAAASEKPVVPPAGEFHEALLAVIATYPTDGTHAYWWPKDSAWAGTTRDLVYQGQVVAEGDPQGRCYCCGLTFEVFFRAWEKWCTDRKRTFRIGDLTAEALLAMRGLWYGSGADGDRTLIRHALVTHRLGFAVDSLADARPGDFVQFWRKSGSGHSVVFQAWVRGADGGIRGIRYWSCQKATQGIGVREEEFGGEQGVDPAQVYVARVGLKP